MPFIDVTLGTGRSPEQVRALIHELTEAAHRAVGAPVANIRVVIREVAPQHWAAGDVTTAERAAARTADGAAPPSDSPQTVGGRPPAPAQEGSGT
ncbi:2-hydroxymuconate tautomerase [Streptomyces bacillaris]|uniref:2-hydroxymuconate tautomerase n=1 Tax=Streptomyces TaxID=1883 RepID=UPI000A1046FE|nr:2-hydroxymuconate tautomerase [Streptomyces sp. S8]NGO84093.1 4-oxalocrotonate tautomerase [Streptomyces sp. 196(2019)]